MTPQDLDFAATEHCHVDIIPAVKMDRLQMIKAEYGPFRPQIRCTVPLWLALTMRASGHCRVVPPDWLSIGTCSRVFNHPHGPNMDVCRKLDKRFKVRKGTAGRVCTRAGCKVFGDFCGVAARLSRRLVTGAARTAASRAVHPRSSTTKDYIRIIFPRRHRPIRTIYIYFYISLHTFN